MPFRGQGVKKLKRGEKYGAGGKKIEKR